VSIRALKEIHTATHPARLARAASAGHEEPEVTASDLLAELDAEARDEP